MSYTPKVAPWPKKFADKIPVSEIFHSIQGEGRYAGHPALFIRLKYCNLGCAWCDTRFTWEEGQIEAGELLTAEQITARATALLKDSSLADDCHLVLTGGEPMLHQDRIPVLIASLQAAGFRFFEIETNGTYPPSAEMVACISWWNCSPKLSNNGLSAAENVVPEALRAIAATGRADFKFVIQSRRDLDELEITYSGLIPHNRIILMPEGTTPAKIDQVGRWLLEECRNRGYRFSSRLHILAWGNERGR